MSSGEASVVVCVVVGVIVMLDVLRRDKHIAAPAIIFVSLAATRPNVLSKTRE